MRPAAFLVCTLICLSAAQAARADTELKPGQVIQLKFPDLPRSLRAVKDPAAAARTGKPELASLSRPGDRSRPSSLARRVTQHEG